MYKILVKLAIIIFITYCLMPKTVYAGIGVTPSELNIEYIKPGGSITKDLVISSSDNDHYNSFSIDLNKEVNEMPYKISVNPKIVNFDMGDNRKSVEINIVVLPSAQDQLYEDNIIIQPILFDEYESGITIIPAISVPIQINVTNDNIEKLLVRSVEFKEYIKGSNISINTTAENKGNIDTKISKANLTLLSLQGDNMLSYETFETEPIKAGEQKDITIEWEDSKDIATGEYYANINLYKDDEILFSDKLYLRHEPFKTEISESDNKPKEKMNNEIIKTNNKKKIILLAMIGAGIVFSLFIHKEYSDKYTK